MALYFTYKGGLLQSLTIFYALLNVLIRNDISLTSDPSDLFDLNEGIGTYLHYSINIFSHLLELLGCEVLMRYSE